MKFCYVHRFSKLNNKYLSFYKIHQKNKTEFESFDNILNIFLLKNVIKLGPRKVLNNKKNKNKKKKGLRS